MVPSCPKRLPCRTAQKAVEGQEWGPLLKQAGRPQGLPGRGVSRVNTDSGLGYAGMRLGTPV